MHTKKVNITPRLGPEIELTSIEQKAGRLLTAPTGQSNLSLIILRETNRRHQSNAQTGRKPSALIYKAKLFNFNSVI